jgi:hypothetical protein
VSTWAAPVYDRTETEAIYARNNPSKTADLKGAWNVSDHTRCEENIAYIYDLLVAMGITPGSITYVTPTIASLGMAAYFNTLAADIEALRVAALPSTSGIVYPSSINFGDYATLRTDFAGGEGEDSIDYLIANAYEEDLLILKNLADALPNELLYCGGFYCGEDAQIQLLTGVI